MRDVVDVEDRDELAVGARERGVDVPRLGIAMVRPPEIRAPEPGGERLEARVAARRRGGRCGAGSAIATAAARLSSTSAKGSSYTGMKTSTVRPGGAGRGTGRSMWM